MSDLPEAIERLDDRPADQHRLQEMLVGAIPIRYADSGGARVKRGGVRGALLLLDLKGHLDVSKALAALKSLDAGVRAEYDLLLSGAITARRSYLIVTAEYRLPAPCSVKLVFNPSRDHDLLRRACSLGILVGAWPRVADQRPLELLLAHPDSARCSCPRCAVIDWALKDRAALDQ